MLGDILGGFSEPRPGIGLSRFILCAESRVKIQLMKKPSVSIRAVFLFNFALEIKE